MEYLLSPGNCMENKGEIKCASVYMHAHTQTHAHLPPGQSFSISWGQKIKKEPNWQLCIHFIPGKALQNSRGCEGHAGKSREGRGLLRAGSSHAYSANNSLQNKSILRWDLCKYKSEHLQTTVKGREARFRTCPGARKWQRTKCTSKKQLGRMHDSKGAGCGGKEEIQAGRGSSPASG